jgi:hypothetical protein
MPVLTRSMTKALSDAGRVEIKSTRARRADALPVSQELLRHRDSFKTVLEVHHTCCPILVIDGVEYENWQCRAPGAPGLPDAFTPRRVLRGRRILGEHTTFSDRVRRLDAEYAECTNLADRVFCLYKMLREVHVHLPSRLLGRWVPGGDALALKFMAACEEFLVEYETRMVGLAKSLVSIVQEPDADTVVATQYGATAAEQYRTLYLMLTMRAQCIKTWNTLQRAMGGPKQAPRCVPPAVPKEVRAITFGSP